MLLAIDIGNTNLVIGCIENDKILFKPESLRTEPELLINTVLKSKI